MKGRHQSARWLRQFGHKHLNRTTVNADEIKCNDCGSIFLVTGSTIYLWKRSNWYRYAWAGNCPASISPVTRCYTCAELCIEDVIE